MPFVRGHQSVFPRTPRSTCVYTRHPTFVTTTSGVLTRLPAKLSKTECVHRSAVENKIASLNGLRSEQVNVFSFYIPMLCITQGTASHYCILIKIYIHVLSYLQKQVAEQGQALIQRETLCRVTCPLYSVWGRSPTWLLHPSENMTCDLWHGPDSYQWNKFYSLHNMKTRVFSHPGYCYKVPWHHSDLKRPLHRYQPTYSFRKTSQHLVCKL